MGANNWICCPRCKARRDLEIEQAKTEALAAYGMVPPEEYEAKMVDARAMKPLAAETFREDYQIGLDEMAGGPVFAIKYKGACTVCNFGHYFVHRQPVPIQEEP